MSQDRNTAPELASDKTPKASLGLVRDMLKRRELRAPKHADEGDAIAVMDRLDCGAAHFGCSGRYAYVPIGDNQCAVRRLAVPAVKAAP